MRRQPLGNVFLPPAKQPRSGEVNPRWYGVWISTQVAFQGGGASPEKSSEVDNGQKGLQGVLQHGELTLEVFVRLLPYAAKSPVRHLGSLSSPGFYSLLGEREEGGHRNVLRCGGRPPNRDLRRQADPME